MSIYTGEKERGTLELLHMQPMNRRRIIFAKLSAMMLSGLFYFIMLLFFMGMIALMIGLPIDGFTELYRVFTPDQSLVMFTGAQLFFRVFISFMLIVLFFSTLLLVISTRTVRILFTMAMAMMNKPELMILDEPLNGLDPTSVIRMRLLLQEIASRGTAILLSSYTLNRAFVL